MMVFGRLHVIRRRLVRWTLLRAVAWGPKSCRSPFSRLDQIHACWRMRRLEPSLSRFPDPISWFRWPSERFWLHAEREGVLKCINSCHWQLTARNAASKVSVRPRVRLTSLPYTCLPTLGVWAACKWCTAAATPSSNSLSSSLWKSQSDPESSNPYSSFPWRPWRRQE